MSVELTRHGHPLDDERNAELAALAARFGLGVVATTAAHFAEPARGRLAMAMGAIRARNSMDEAAGWLAPLGVRICGRVRRWRSCSLTIPMR